MPRTARISPKGYIYHLLTRGNNRQDVFKSEEDYAKYIKIITHYKEKCRFKLYHYVLMSNHIHLIIEPTEDGKNLSEIMKGINISYAQYFKMKYKQIGHFWQDRFKSIIISKDRYLLSCGNYVELNPVRAGIVNNPKDYKWSSYNFYASGKESAIINEDPVYTGLSQNEAERKRLYRESIDEAIKMKNAMKNEMDKKIIYASENLIKDFMQKYKLNETVKSVGRPKKTIVLGE